MQIISIQGPPCAADDGYLLIEPANMPDYLQESLPSMHACVPPFLWAAEASMPRLLRLDSLSALQKDVLSQLIRHDSSQKHPPVVCAWLQSTKSTEEIANCVAKSLHGHLPDGSKVIWRYYDPRVFILIAHIFKEEQGNALLDKIEKWAFPWCNHWWCVQRTASFMPITTDLDLGWPTKSQWELLQKSRQLHLIHCRLQQTQYLSASCLDDLKNSVAAFIETEKYINLDDDKIRAEFTYLSSRYGRHFRDYYELMPKWELLRNRKITLQQMLGGLTNQDFDYLESKLNDARMLV